MKFMEPTDENVPVATNTSDLDAQTTTPARRGRRRAKRRVKEKPVPAAESDQNDDNENDATADVENSGSGAGNTTDGTLSHENSEEHDESHTEDAAAAEATTGDEGDGDVDGGANIDPASTGRRKRRVRKVRKVKKKKKKKPTTSNDDEDAPADDGPLDATDLDSSAAGVGRQTGDEATGADRDAEIDNESVVAIVIEGADTLPPNMQCLHPVVRIHVVSTEDGKYVSKLDPNRNAVHQNENMVTTQDSDVEWKPKTKTVPFILPLLTRPYHFRGKNSYAPKWKERFIVDQPFSHVVNSKQMVLCELLDFGRAATDPSALGSAEALDREVDKNPAIALGWHRLAWAFLKLEGADGVSHTNKRVRLQLYEYIFPPPKSGLNAPSSTWPPDVWYSYNAWAKNRRKRKSYGPTLYMTVQRVPRPRPTDVIRRPLYPHQRECGPMANRTRDHDGEAKATSRTRDGGSEGGRDDAGAAGAGKDDKEEIRRVVTWSRLPGQRSRVPNAVKSRIDAGPRGAYTVRWSRSGEFLAVACSSKTSVFPIKIYDIFTEKVVKTLQGHHDFIYELDWSNDDRILVSASSDGIVKLWDVSSSSSSKSNVDEHGKIAPMKQYQHTSFVYCARFYTWNSSKGSSASALSTLNTSGVGLSTLDGGGGVLGNGNGTKSVDVEVLATGSFDGMIRLWRCDTGEVYQYCNSHKKHVNCICFDEKGTRMYSGDGSGSLIIWTGKMEKPKPTAHTAPKPQKRDDGSSGIGNDTSTVNVKLPHFEPMRTVVDPELHGSPITSLSIVNNRLLIHSRHNMLRTMDLRLFSFVQHYSGLVNYRWGIKSHMSTDGMYIVSGSEDGKVFYWKAETGALTSSIPMGHDNAVTDCEWHPHDDIVAIGSFGESGPPVLICHYDRAKHIAQEERDIAMGKKLEDMDTPRTARSGIVDPLEERRKDRMRRKMERAREAELKRRLKEVNLDLEPLTLPGGGIGGSMTDRSGRSIYRSTRSSQPRSARVREREDENEKEKAAIRSPSYPYQSDEESESGGAGGGGVGHSESHEETDTDMDSELADNPDLREIVKEEEEETTILRNRIQSLLSRGSSLTAFVRGGTGPDGGKSATSDALRRLNTPLAQSKLGIGRMGVANAAMAVGATEMVDQIIAMEEGEEDQDTGVDIDAEKKEEERSLAESQASIAAAAAERRENRRRARQEKMMQSDAGAGTGVDIDIDTAAATPLVSRDDRRKAHLNRRKQSQGGGEGEGEGAAIAQEASAEVDIDVEPSTTTSSRPEIPRLPIEPLGSNPNPTRQRRSRNRNREREGAADGDGEKGSVRQSRSKRFRDRDASVGDAAVEEAGPVVSEMQIEEFE